MPDTSRGYNGISVQMCDRSNYSTYHVVVSVKHNRWAQLNVFVYEYTKSSLIDYSWLWHSRHSYYFPACHLIALKFLYDLWRVCEIVYFDFWRNLALESELK
jgi:hypothetical protein